MEGKANKQAHLLQSLREQIMMIAFKSQTRSHFNLILTILSSKIEQYSWILTK